MDSNGTPPPGDGGATRRNVLKGATAAVGAFIAFEAIGGVSLAAGASPKATQLANGGAALPSRVPPPRLDQRWSCEQDQVDQQSVSHLLRKSNRPRSSRFRRS